MPVRDARWWGTSPQLLRLMAALLTVLLFAACGSAGDEGAAPEATDDGDDPTEDAGGQASEEPEPGATTEDGGDVAEGPVWGDDGVLQPLADGFPEREIVMYVVHPPGHADEFFARTVIEAAGELSPVPIVMQNQPSGPQLQFETMDYMETLPGGTEGYAVAAAALGALPFRLVTTVGPSGSRDIDDLADSAVVITEGHSVVLGVPQDSEFETLDDLVEFAKANPGRLRIATSAIGSSVHIEAEMLAADLDFTYVAVPNDGVGAAQQTMLAGGAEAVTTVPAQVAPLLEDGTIRALLQWGPQRSSVLPDTPSSADLGYRGIGVTRGVMTHPDTPPEHKAWLEALFLEAAESDVYKQRLEEFGLDPLFMGSEEAGESLQAIYDEVLPIITDLGLAAD